MTINKSVNQRKFMCAGVERATSITTRISIRAQDQSICERLLLVLCIILCILCPLAWFFCFKVVDQYSRAVILRFGKLRWDSPAGPGLVFTLPCVDTCVLIDLRTQSFNLPAQEILTKDSVTVTVDAVMYFHVREPLSSLLNVAKFRYATEMLAISNLRNILGHYTLTSLLTNRELISASLRTEIEKETNEWGIEVERVEIKDVILPHDLQKAMAAEAEGSRLGKAKIIEAEGEIKAAENLREAARIFEQNPQAMLLRYLQTLNYIGAEEKTTIIFPIPVEIPSSTRAYR